MITKISKEGWELAYYGKWLKAQDKTRRKVKWNEKEETCGFVGWKDLIINRGCSYCYELEDDCRECSLTNSICALPSGPYFKYCNEMDKPRTNWKRANELCDQIVEAIKQDGVEWGYYKEKTNDR